MKKSYPYLCGEIAGKLRILLMTEQCSETMRRELTEWLKGFEEFDAEQFQKLQSEAA